jgi:two-component system, OmpR family, phosphate regulon response regulator PhoB
MEAALEHALVIDSDPDLRALVAARLAEQGFEVSEAPEGRSALAAVEQSPPDVIIVEVELADMDGFDILRLLRRATDAPVIVVSNKDDESDRITGLDLGADDYVVKPVSVAELMARVRAVTRRSRPAPAEGGLRFGELLIDRRSREVRIGGSRVALTHREFDLLAYLASSPGQVFSRDQLLDQVWGSSSAWQDSKTVTEHIRRLRVKLGTSPDATDWIRTVHGVGYAFTTGNTAD